MNLKKIIIIAVTSVLSVVTLLLLNLINDIPLRELIYASVSALFLIVGSVVLKLFSPKISFKRFFRFLPLRVNHFFIILWATLLAISGSYIINYFEFLIVKAIGIDSYSLALSGMDMENIWIMLLSVGLIPSLFEEIFFRGACLSSLNYSNTLLSVLITSLFFFIIHGSVYGIICYVFVGVVFSYLTITTGTVFAAIITHLINNIITYFLNLYSEKLSLIGMNYIIVIALGFVFLISLYGFLTCIYRKYHSTINKVDNINEGEYIWKNLQKEEENELSK